MLSVGVSWSTKAENGIVVVLATDATPRGVLRIQMRPCAGAWPHLDPQYTARRCIGCQNHNNAILGLGAPADPNRQHVLKSLDQRGDRHD